MKCPICKNDFYGNLRGKGVVYWKKYCSQLKGDIWVCKNCNINHESQDNAILEKIKDLDPAEIYDTPVSREYLMELKQKALGIVLGIGAGLLVDSILIVRGGIEFYWFTIMTLGVPLIVPVIIGIVSGRGAARERWVPEVPWAVIALVAIVWWPLCMYAPVGVRTFHLKLIASQEIPNYPGAEKVKTYVKAIGDSDTGPRVRIVIRTKAALEEIVQFYEGKLIRRGWKKGSKNLIKSSYTGTPHWFEKHGRWLSIHVRERHQLKSPPSWWSEEWEGFNQVAITVTIGD